MRIGQIFYFAVWTKLKLPDHFVPSHFPGMNGLPVLRNLFLAMSAAKGANASTKKLRPANIFHIYPPFRY
jgi:hypothetical protein